MTLITVALDRNLFLAYYSSFNYYYKNSSVYLDVYPYILILKLRRFKKVFKWLVASVRWSSGFVLWTAKREVRFIHSFIPDIYIAPLQVHYYSVAQPDHRRS